MKYVIILKVKGKIYDKNGKEIEFKHYDLTTVTILSMFAFYRSYIVKKCIFDEYCR